MKFWIEDENGEIWETFETEGHAPTNTSAHLDAMKQVEAWGYSNHEDYYLVTEDGFIYEAVNPYTDSHFQNFMAYDYGVILEQVA